MNSNAEHKATQLELFRILQRYASLRELAALQKVYSEICNSGMSDLGKTIRLTNILYDGLAYNDWPWSDGFVSPRFGT